MEIFKNLPQNGFQEIVFGQDPDSNLKAIIAVHDTTLGPALGGTRIWPYKNEESALTDVLRLARGMTYKAACAGLNLGGGKAVIIADPQTQKTEALLRAYGRMVDSLQGLYITAEDVGTCQEDMDVIAQETRFVTGVSPERGGSGDPSPFTALGVFHGIKAACREIWHNADLTGITVAIQGVGHVGSCLAVLLKEAGAELVLSDLHPEAAQALGERLGAKVVDIEEIYSVSCEVFAPCALGAVLNDYSIPRLKCQAVAGAANNVLLEERHGYLLHELNILYAPDYVINAGGVINVASELDGYDREKVLQKVRGLEDQLGRIFARARAEGVPPFIAAERLAEERLAQARLSRMDGRGAGRLG